MNIIKVFSLYLKNAVKSTNWHRILFVLTVAKALVWSPGFADAAVIACLVGFEAFTYYIREVRIRPMNEQVQFQLNEMRTKLASFESRDRIERMAAQTSTNTNNTPRRMF